MPDGALLSVTPKAAAKVTQMLEKQGKAGGALRVKVIGGGCSGLQYKLDLEPAPSADDTVVESSGVRVLVDPSSALYIFNSQVDYVESFKFSGFKINNPNAVAECSCGQSFTV